MHAAHDIVIIGGSYAGMAAGLQVARARRSVLIIDAGIRRNRFARNSHGFLGQDGQSGARIATRARKQLAAYPNLTRCEGTVIRAGRDGADFQVEIATGQRFTAKRLILASGVSDELPEIPGLRQRWGKSIFHCPYCHGYELNSGRIGVLATNDVWLHQALLLPDWGQTTLLTNGKVELDSGTIAQLTERGVSTETTPIAAITGDRANVQLSDGRMVELDGLFVAPTTRISSPLAEQLGCALEDGPTGQFIRTDAMKETSVAGVFACGDAARPAGSVSLAVGDGAMAGAAAHQSLVFR